MGYLCMFMIGVKVAERLNGDPVPSRRHRAAPPAEEHRPPGQRADAASNVAAVVAAALGAFFAGGAPVRFTFWDGSTAGPENTPGCVVVHSPTALTRMLWSPNELGMARAFVAGDIDIDGDFYGVLKALRRNATVTAKASPRAFTSALSVAMRLGAVGPPPKRPDEEVRLSGWRHSKQRDSAAIRHHYDVGDAFYRLILGPAMTYSCARFEAGEYFTGVGPTVKTRSHLPKTRVGRQPGQAAARRGLRMGFDGHPRRPGVPGESGRHNP